VVACADVIYPSSLETLETRLELIVASFTVAQLLEEQGKGADRKACMASIDSLRTARRNDLPALLPSFQVPMCPHVPAVTSRAAVI
jgi:hypothetical protein